MLTKLSEGLKQKEKAISSILDAIEKGIYTNSTQERLLKLENEKSILEEKITIEKAHSLKPLEKKNIVNFLKIYASKEFDSVRDRNEFFNNFISRVNLYDDRITIVYNTSLDPAEEIYTKSNDDKNDNNDNSNENSNNNGTTIYKKELNFENVQEESRSNFDEFKRLFDGGVNAIRF